MTNKLQTYFSQLKLSNLGKPREGLKLEYFIYMFFPIYCVLSVLFWSAGYYGKVFFTFISLLLIALMLLVIGKFVIYLANALNQKHVAAGLVFAKAMFLLVVPTAMLKIVSHTLIIGLPVNHPVSGVLCDGITLMRRLYFQFAIQQSLSYLLWGSVIFLAIYLLLALSRRI